LLNSLDGKDPRKPGAPFGKDLNSAVDFIVGSGGKTGGVSGIGGGLQTAAKATRVHGILCKVEVDQKDAGGSEHLSEPVDARAREESCAISKEVLTKLYASAFAAGAGETRVDESVDKNEPCSSKEDDVVSAVDGTQTCVDKNEPCGSKEEDAVVDVVDSADRPSIKHQTWPMNKAADGTNDEDTTEKRKSVDTTEKRKSVEKRVSFEGIVDDRREAEDPESPRDKTDGNSSESDDDLSVIASSESSDNLSYDAERVTAPDKKKIKPPLPAPRPPAPVVIPPWAHPPQRSAASMQAEHAWHISRGNVRAAARQCQGGHAETLSRVLNPVMPSSSVPSEPPPTPQWPLLATGASRVKHRWVNKLYNTMTEQRGGRSSGTRRGVTKVSVEAVCLAHELRTPREHIARGLTGQQPSVSYSLPQWQAPDSGRTSRLHLPQIQHDSKHPDVQEVIHQSFREAVTKSDAPINGTPARHKFLQEQSGWQPWRTHRPNAFDNQR